MKRISSNDLLVFVLMAVLILGMDFNNMAALNWIGCIVAVIWVILFIIKLVLPKERSDK